MQEKLIKIGLLLGVCVIFQLNTMQEHEKIDISVAFDKDSAAQLRVGSIPIDTTVRSGYSTARDIIQHIVEDVIIKIHNYPYHIHNPRLEWAYKNGFLFLWKDNKQLLPSDTIHASSGDTILIKYDGPELPRVQTKPKPSAPVGEYLKQYGTLKPVDISHRLCS